MRSRGGKFIVATLVVVLVLAVGVSAASARRIAVNINPLDMIFDVLKASASGFEVACPVTLAGSFHSRSISKLENIKWGLVFEALVAESRCTGGRARVLSESLPWEINYASFSRLLPRIEWVATFLVNAAWLVFVNSVFCELHTTASEPAKLRFLIEGGGRVTGYEAEPNATIALRGGFACLLVGAASLSGVGRVREVGGLPITITLIA